LAIKKVLITTGSTWVPIDRARIISNLATGETGALLAQALKKRGSKVTILRGPLEFKIFAESLIKELKYKRFDAVIHGAAVCDYQLKNNRSLKIKSGLKCLNLKLTPTPKLINLIKRFQPKTILVGFKFEPQASKSVLIKEAKRLILNSNADMVVANSNKKNKYFAFIVTRSKAYGPFMNKPGMVAGLIKTLEE